MQTIYIGIDDTDNLDTRGTGFRARQLADRLCEDKLAQIIGVTRHQLLVDDRVPYTSHNSSACIAVRPDCDTATLMDYCRCFLLALSFSSPVAAIIIAQADR